MERNEENQERQVLHGGEGDPLGGGVAELDDEADVSEGVPQQDQAGSEDD